MAKEFKKGNKATPAKKKTPRKSSEKLKRSLIKEIVIAISGQGSEKIVDLLYGKENVNEFDIAKRLKMTINQARNILYKLADHGLVSFTRKKDKKNGGWYTYFWTLDNHKSLQVLQNQIKKEIHAILLQLQSRKSKRYYYCENCDLEMTEEEALLHNFVCPECGEVFELKDNEDSIEHLKNHLEAVKKRYASVLNELSVIEEQEEEARKRRHKAAERRAKAKRKRAAAKRAKERKKTQTKKAEPKTKASKKKPSKKKPARKKKVVKKASPRKKTSPKKAKKKTSGKRRKK